MLLSAYLCVCVCASLLERLGGWVIFDHVSLVRYHTEGCTLDMHVGIVGCVMDWLKLLVVLVFAVVYGVGGLSMEAWVLGAGAKAVLVFFGRLPSDRK